MLLAAVMLLACGSVEGQNRPDYSDLPGPYCEKRPDSERCCSGRTDECSVSILGTLCYCDAFCDRGLSGDCCPDFFAVCLGETANPVHVCSHNGRNLAHGESFMDNCNKCTCSCAAERAAVSCEEHTCLVRPELIEAVNERASELGWTASNYTKFWGRRLEEGMRLLLGTRRPGQQVFRTQPVSKVVHAAALPSAFDARARWPGLVGGVQDQGWCGASWAVATAAAAADQLSVHGRRRVSVSAQNIVDCAPADGQDGCRGGELDRAWSFLRLRRVSSSQCYPYRSGVTGVAGRCLTPAGPGRSVQLDCQNGSRVSVGWHQLYGMQPPFRVASDEASIRHEILTNGPVQAILRVRPEFFLYKSGVYREGPGDPTYAAYHSVRLLGWGEENTASGGRLPYWLVANSWGVDWGEGGLFRIRRGVNEADIEAFVVIAWPQFDHLVSRPHSDARPDSKNSL